MSRPHPHPPRDTRPARPRGSTAPDRCAPDHIAITGSGSLARSVCYSIAASFRRTTRVWILARSHEKAAEVAYVAGTRAGLDARPVAFHAVRADLDAPDALADVLAGIAPRVVLHCASYHSTREPLPRTSPWSALVRRAGFGITLPLQARLAIDVARALTLACPDALLLNACFPDAVNPLLRSLGLPVLCGIGNVAILAATLQCALGLRNQRHLQVLAHHAQLHRPDVPDDEALVWCRSTPVGEVGALLAPERAAARGELNHVTGHAAALLLRDLLDGREVFANLPGPLGMPGGYPVVLRGGDVRLRLPAGMSVAEAVTRNERAAHRDGIAALTDRVEHTAATEEHLRRHLPDIAAGFPVSETGAACDLLVALRTRMRDGN